MKTSVLNELAIRFSENPLLTLSEIKPTSEGLNVVGILNPAVIRFEKKTWLLIRVVQRPDPVADNITISAIEKLNISKDGAELDFVHPRVARYDANGYPTTHSHFQLLCSNDGRTFFQPENYDAIFGAGVLENYGIEDCRVTEINGIYYLTYTMRSTYGAGVGLMQTRDWKRFERKGMIFPPPNKDCAIFEEKIRDRYYALHSPGSPGVGGNYIWIAESLDTLHWGNHRCLATTRESMWDSGRINAGCSPIQTPQGWLVIYNGADVNNRGCLGGLLLAANEPWRVIARSDSPLMEPTEIYETGNAFENTIFTNGHVVVGDKLRLYYGARDEVICGAELSIHEILNSLSPVKD